MLPLVLGELQAELGWQHHGADKTHIDGVDGAARLIGHPVRLAVISEPAAKPCRIGARIPAAQAKVGTSAAG